MSSLKRETALRKTASLLQGFEVDLLAGESVDVAYLSDLISEIILPARSEFLKPAEAALSLLRRFAENATEQTARPPVPGDSGTRTLRRICNDLRHMLYAYLGIVSADWDLLPPSNFSPVPERRAVLPFAVFLEDLRSPFNVGSVFRSAESFCVERVILTPSCPRPDSPRASRSAMGSEKIVPWTIGGLEALHEEVVFALETGGTPLESFDFPEKGVVILGNEELGVSPEARKRAEESAGVVSIPLHGVKGSLNVTAAFAILVHSWCNRKLSSLQGTEE